MQLISESMLRFRDLSRDVWNFGIGNHKDAFHPAVQRSRDIIEKELLRILVLLPFKCEQSADDYRVKPISQILINGKKEYSEIPVLKATIEPNSNIVWKKDKTISSINFPLMNFFEFFDWNSYGNVNMNLIKSFSMSEKSFYLIEDRYCEFFFNGEI